MKFSHLLIPTYKEVPAEAQLVSHQLMLRAGLIHKLASGIYSWLPLGRKVLSKVQSIISSKMDSVGFQQVSMPMVQPANLWMQSGRWDKYGAELLRLQDRHKRDFCLGPTHEEIVSSLVKDSVNSYKQFPVKVYQVQSKFRDEIRPRFGVMRAREFVMKDAYSFHINTQCLQSTYRRVFDVYSQIFSSMDIEYKAVEADSGNIGGLVSHEFHALADSGEDTIAYSDSSDYAANVELACCKSEKSSKVQELSLEKVVTPSITTISQVCHHLQVVAASTVKTLVVLGDDDRLVALVLRGDHSLNEVKLNKVSGFSKGVRFASSEQIRELVSCSPGYLGPCGLKIPVVVDHSAYQLSNFVCGANEEDCHLKNVSWQRDVLADVQVVDLRLIQAGDLSPCGKGKVKLQKGIELGHVFQLGAKYTKAMSFKVIDDKGKGVAPIMGCYGIGVSRVVAAIIEQHHDKHGIVWPKSVSPFDVVIAPINASKSAAVSEASAHLYDLLVKAGFQVLWYDKKQRAGVMFAEVDLIGISKKVIVSDKLLADNLFELKDRKNSSSLYAKLGQVVSWLQES